MRRFGATLAIIAIALVGTAAVATAASVPLTKVTVSDGGRQAEREVRQAIRRRCHCHRVITEGSGDKLAKGDRIGFDYLVVDGRTGAELGTSFGATPVATVLDRRRRLRVW